MVRESILGRVDLKPALHSKREVSWCGQMWDTQGAEGCTDVSRLACRFGGMRVGTR